MSKSNDKLFYYFINQLEDYWQTLSKSKFVGYVWMSDAPLKHIWTSYQSINTWDELHQNNNFIWEANLYQENKRSISIQQVNDKWKVFEWIWNENPKEKNYISDGKLLDGCYLMQHYKHKLHFKEAWVPQEDPLCCDMKVLQPAWSAFIGFCE